MVASVEENENEKKHENRNKPSHVNAAAADQHSFISVHPKTSFSQTQKPKALPVRDSGKPSRSCVRAK
jgi:hypothetical protein